MHTYFDYDTDSSLLIAALQAMGISCLQPDGRIGTMATKDFRVWTVSDVSDCGKWKRKELEMFWRDKDFNKNNPQHPFAYVKCAVLNAHMIQEFIRKDKPLVSIKKGDSFALLHPDCSSDTERKILQHLK